MLSIDDLRFFALVANENSLAASARALDVSPSAVTQRLNQIEARVGVRLLNRRKGANALTDEGRQVVERARSVLDQLEGLQDDIAKSKWGVTGTLRIAAPLGFGRRHIAPIAAGLQERHPALRIELTLVDRPLRSQGNFDAVIHIGSAPRYGAVVVPLAPNERFVCAAPRYVEEHGAPANAEELKRHRCIVLRENDEDTSLWQFRHAGRPVGVRLKPALASNDGEAVQSWARMGMGIIVRSEWAVADDLRAGRLVQILKTHAIESAPIIALVEPSPARAARTQEFLRFTKRALKPPPWRAKRTT